MFTAKHIFRIPIVYVFILCSLWSHAIVVRAQCSGTLQLPISSCAGDTLTLLSNNTAAALQSIQWSLNGTNVYNDATVWNIHGTTVATNIFAGGIAVDAQKNIFVTNPSKHTVLKYTVGNSTPQIIAGTNGSSGSSATKLNAPVGIFLDATGNLYVADKKNHRIQKFISGATTGTTVAGSGVSGATAAQLSYPVAVFVDNAGSIYVCDSANNRVQKFPSNSTKGTNAQTVAGASNGMYGKNGDSLRAPTALWVDNDSNIYVVDNYYSRVKKFANTAPTTISIVAGNSNGAYGTNAKSLKYPRGIFVDASGNIYVSDNNNNRVQEWLAPYYNTGVTIAGSAQTTADNNDSSLTLPTALTMANGILYVADNGNARIQQYTSSINCTHIVTDTGKYTVFAHYTDACVTSIATTVRTISKPYVQNITACQDSVPPILSDAVSGDHLLWYDAATNIQLTTPPIITTNTAHTDSVLVSQTVYGCESPTSKLIITVAPPPPTTLVMDTFLCNGKNISLRAGDVQATYLWNTGETQQSIVINKAGVYSAKIIAPNGCATIASCVVRTAPLPIVDLGTDTTVCTPSVVMLHAGDNSNTYMWNTGETTPDILVAHQGKYIVQVRNQEGCSSIDSKVININESPNADSIHCVLMDSVATLSVSNAKNVDTYTWVFDNQDSTQEIQPVRNFSVGTHTITTTLRNTCGAYELAKTIDILPPLSIENYFHTYPNPASSTLFLKNDSKLLMRTATLLNIQSQPVYKTNVYGDILSIDVSTFPSGVYHLVLQMSNSAKVIKKIMILH